MPRCRICGNKGSVFDIFTDGVCESCMESGAEQKMIEKQVKDFERGIVPVLPCVMNQSLEISGNSLVVVSKNNRQTIPISSIASFQLDKPHGSVRGTIRIGLSKGSDGFLSLGAVSLGIGSEIIAVFLPMYLYIAEMYEKYIMNYGNNNTQAAGSSVPTVNDLRALKQLVDEGVLTEEEFTAKKKQLLGI